MKKTIDIPKGYKQSPVGVIPAEWEVKRLGEISDIGSGGTPSKKNSEYWNGEIPWITTSLLNQLTITRADEYITVAGLENSSAKLLKKGVLLMAMYGQGQTRGRVAKLEIGAATNQACAYIDINNGSKDFIFQYLTANYEHIRKESNDGNQKNLSLGIITRIEVPFPSLPEQRKIAELLSTWDKAIELQTSIIDKLALRKKGLMQQLLTGKKRLKGFSEPWENTRLDNVSERITRENIYGCNNVVTVSAQKGFVLQTDFFKKTIASNIIDNYYLVKKGEFCYNKSYSNGYPMGAIKRLKEYEEAVVTTLYICFSINEKNVVPDFIEQYFECGLMNRELIKVANEGGRAHGLLNVTPKDFFNIKLHLPSLVEQREIAEVLSTTDVEIQKERQKLEALKQQKKGLMQQLLTGKKRVITK